MYTQSFWLHATNLPQYWGTHYQHEQSKCKRFSYNRHSSNSPLFDASLLLHDLFFFLWVDISKQASLSLQLIDLHLLDLQLTFKNLHHNQHHRYWHNYITTAAERSSKKQQNTIDNKLKTFYIKYKHNVLALHNSAMWQTAVTKTY